MSTIIQLVDLIEKTACDDAIYLLEPLSEKAGFFCQNHQLLFMEKSDSSGPNDSIDTRYLKLITRVNVHAIKNGQSFDDGLYNIIMFKTALCEDTTEPFLKLCTVYAKNREALDFKSFFYSLVELFQIERENDVKNALGLFGELIIIKTLFEEFGVDISKYWHSKGPFSKLDFSNGSMALEIKTTTIESSNITIKHDQIFNSEAIYLISVLCEMNEIGDTLKDLISYFDSKSHDNFNSLQFQINLTKELQRIAPSIISNQRYWFEEYRVFSTKAINPFITIPKGVSGLQYHMDVDKFDSLDEKGVKEVLELLEKE